MSILDKIAKPADRAVAVTIIADSGMGKTNLAAAFPKPVFIRAEDGMQGIPADVRPDALPVITSVDDVWEQIGALIKEEHDYKTVVIDSVTALDRLFTQYVIDNDPKRPKSINQANGGYGAGVSSVATMHQRVRKGAAMLIDRGIHVVFIAHADTETIELPDSDPYTRYNMRLHRKSQAPYLDDADVAAFIRLETFTTGDGERKKAISNGDRQIICYATAANVSKNRFGIVDPLYFEQGTNPLADYIPSLNS